MSALDRLIVGFTRFPGIGPRQARRFVYFLLRESPAQVMELAEAMIALKKEVFQCPDCQRYFTKKNGGATCTICDNGERDRNLLMLVEKDVDLETIERATIYQGHYFVLGGLLPMLEEEPGSRLRLGALERRIKKEAIAEVIIALSANLEGDHTVDFIRSWLSEKFPKIKMSVLGRGLSTGTELEYSDRDTLLYAFKNRS